MHWVYDSLVRTYRCHCSVTYYRIFYREYRIPPWAHVRNHVYSYADTWVEVAEMVSHKHWL